MLGHTEKPWSWGREGLISDTREILLLYNMLTKRAITTLRSQKASSTYPYCTDTYNCFVVFVVACSESLHPLSCATSWERSLCWFRINHFRELWDTSIHSTREASLIGMSPGLIEVFLKRKRGVGEKERKKEEKGEKNKNKRHSWRTILMQ
ncbi:hypothetical protein VTI74DRAFT_3688 [Chaetomium olivicolor]